MLPPGTYNLASKMKNTMSSIYKDYNSNGTSSIIGVNLGELREIRNAWYNNKQQGNPIIIPAVHLTMGYHSNKSDSHLLRSVQFREKAAEELTQAVLEYFDEK